MLAGFRSETISLQLRNYVCDLTNTVTGNKQNFTY